ncbi:hypothetical protein GJ496_004388 [Pomphorhynchus laevis]|nr:hypothetical protein GJ496_004388 [Pomphorhynchus laevis]
MSSVKISIYRKVSFSSAHFLYSKHFDHTANEQIYGSCSHRAGHGHNYRLTVTLEGPVNVKTGMLFNLRDLDAALTKVISDVDHKNLNVDVKFFKDRVSTVENLVLYMFARLDGIIGNRLVSEIRIEETDTFGATLRRQEYDNYMSMEHSN